MCSLSRNLEKTELPVYSVKAHKEIINCINGIGGAGIGEGAPELVTGSRDGEWSVLFNMVTIITVNELHTTGLSTNRICVIDLMHNDVILWSQRLKSFENGYA